MSEEIDHKAIKEKESAEKIASFEKKLALLRLRSDDQNDKKVTKENFFAHAVVAAESVFTTPAEFAKHAIPYILTSKDWVRYSHNIKKVLPLLEKWELTDRPPTVIAVMDYVAHNSYWLGDSFVEEYGALAKKYLPENKREIVFKRVIGQRGYPIPRTSDICERAEFWAKTVQDYVPQDKWPRTYLILKQRLVDAVKRPGRNGVVDINTGKIEHVAETLARFGAALPLNAKRKADILNDVIALLTTPEKFYPDKEIKEKEYRFDASRKGIILFEAKRDLDASRLSPDDYGAVVAFVTDKDNRSSFTDRIATLKACAEKCLPEDTRTDRLVTDMLQSGTTYFTERPYNYILAEFAEALKTSLSNINLNDDQGTQIKQFFTDRLINLAVNGDLQDREFYKIFNSVAELLSPAQRLSWAEEFIVRPFLNSDLSKNEPVMPFLGFLTEQFQKVVGRPEEQKIMATKHMTSGYVAGQLIVAFSESTVIGRSGDKDKIILCGETLLTRSVARENFTNKSSIPLVRKLHTERFDKIVETVGLNREVA